MAQAPLLLCTVRQLNIELHTSSTYQKMTRASDMTKILRHLWIDHGFRVFRSTFNTGWKPEARTVNAELRSWGFPKYGCCFELQMLRVAEPRHCRAAAASE